ncbi:MAG: RNase H family protein [Patescibacteria group bacterium]
MNRQSSKKLNSELKQVILFTDGSSRGNPGPGGWGSVMVYPDSHGILKVDELGGREKVTTNNRMEISAVAFGLMHIDGFYENLGEVLFIIYTDSSYVLNGATKWIHGWKRNNWISSTKEPVKNQDLWEELSLAIEGKNIEWRLVPGHAGVPGNERCDVIATSFADSSPVDLYKGPISKYLLKDILDVLDTNHADIPRNPNKKSSSKAYSYISMVDGDVQTHATWVECEARVKGKSGARFKKSSSPQDEAEIIRQFSV